MDKARFEQGNPIVDEFIESWNSIERFYDEIAFPSAPQIRTLIATLRDRGYDRSLRAGQSLWMLVVSRSRHHGLREDQPRIVFWFLADDGMDVYVNGDREKRTHAAIELTPDIDALLKTLEAANID